MTEESIKQIKQLIDLTKLDLATSFAEAQALADIVLAQDLHSTCIRPSLVKKLINFNKAYRLSAVLAFPEEKIIIAGDLDINEAKKIIGKNPKITEAETALIDGASELDPVMNIGNLNGLQKELQEIIQIMFSFSVKYPDQVLWLKPIFSCELLNDDELEKTVKIFSDTVNDFYKKNPAIKKQIKFAYKNSTGFVISKEGSGFKLKTTSAELISKITNLLDQYDPEKNIYIKAAGGIRDLETALLIKDAAQGRLSHIGTSRIFW